jgi:hypothetical protein
MNKEERLVYITEQKLLGYHVIFKDRWDHHLALKALAKFDGVETLVSLITGNAIETRIEQRRLFDGWARYKNKKTAVSLLVLEYLENSAKKSHNNAAYALRVRRPNYFHNWKAVVGRLRAAGLVELVQLPYQGKARQIQAHLRATKAGEELVKKKSFRIKG